MNKVILEGRICSDIKPVGESGVRFTVAVRRNFKNKQTGNYDSDFISCIAWSGSAKLISDYFSKGDPISIVGEWRSGSYEKDGATIYTNDVLVSEVGFVTGARLKKSQQGYRDTDSVRVATGLPPVGVPPVNATPFSFPGEFQG